jgi:sugar phosphate isomerase/epimerase
VYAVADQGISRKGRRIPALAKAGVYGGYLGWQQRPGRFRSLGDGQVDFKQVFSG